ncbi:DUF724 domain-containing protein [Populus alba x Populus x berolinensis]|nr:DUF724 domain-containing protein [Populus alba x Populus x berolinensis]
MKTWTIVGSNSHTGPKEMEIQKKKCAFGYTFWETFIGFLNLELQKVPNTKLVKPIESLKDVKFSKGMLVEVSSDEDGFKGAWFAASIVEPVGKDKYLVEYKSLRTEDDSGFLREEVSTMHIRPPPPQTMLEEVDALYNDVWWVGVVCEVNTFPQYVVSFKDTGEELEFKHSDLRPHQDWINGKWVAPSHILRLNYYTKKLILFFFKDVYLFIMHETSLVQPNRAHENIRQLPWPRTGLGSFYMFTAVKVNDAE